MHGMKWSKRIQLCKICKWNYNTDDNQVIEANNQDKNRYVFIPIKMIMVKFGNKSIIKNLDKH